VSPESSKRDAVGKIFGVEYFGKTQRAKEEHHFRRKLPTLQWSEKSSLCRRCAAAFSAA
jgi:hypothetical protein